MLLCNNTSISASRELNRDSRKDFGSKIEGLGLLLFSMISSEAACVVSSASSFVK